MNNTYTEYEYKLNSGKTIKAYKGYTKCPNCDKVFELDTTIPELFGKAICIECYKKNYNHNLIGSTNVGC
jgi:hypothetical protein